MKPAPFRYLRPRDLDELLQVMATHGDEGKVLAGGQSLGPLLNLRLATPAVLVDVNTVPELAVAPAEDGSVVTVSAMTRQADAERSALLASRCPLLTQALPFVAHRTIRNRGTVGGSLAHADPAAELPAVAVAAGAELVVQSLRGRRVVPARDFFQSYFTTALEDDEVLTSIVLPASSSGDGSDWQEFAPRHGDYAIVGVAVHVHLDESGVVTAARLVCSGVAEKPYEAVEAGAVLVGQRPTDELVADAAAAAGAGSRPSADLIASAEYRRHLVGRLAAQGLKNAIQRAQEV